MEVMSFVDGPFTLQSKLKCIGDITGMSEINDIIVVSLVCVIPLIYLGGITSINSITGMGRVVSLLWVV